MFNAVYISIEKNFVIDSSQFNDKRIKVRIRNTSGDPNFNLNELQDHLKKQYII